jgi:hypothetical protein
MKRLTTIFGAACAIAAGSAPLYAQQFEGVMKFVSYENAGQPDTMTQITKGSKIRFEGMNKGRGDGGAMIMDGDTRMVLLTSEKKYMILPASFGAKEGARESKKHHGEAQKTGKTEMVAGIPCSVWHYQGTGDNGKPEEGEACIAKGAGLMINRLAGGMKGSYFDVGGEAFAAELKNGGGVMKVTANGKVVLAAVKAEATSVPDAMFAPPAGYTKMEMGGMGGPHKP